MLLVIYYGLNYVICRKIYNNVMLSRIVEMNIESNDFYLVMFHENDARFQCHWTG